MITFFQLLTRISIILATSRLRDDPNESNTSNSIASIKCIKLITVIVRSGLGCTNCLRRIGEHDEVSYIKDEKSETKIDTLQPCHYMTSASRTKCVPCCQKGERSCIEV